MRVLLKKLIELKKMGAVAVKQSLEDEGASFQDLVIMRKLTKKANLKLNVKVGGCEAINDILFCSALKVDGIVAPMVESEYALKKFVQSIPKKCKSKLYINLESRNAFNNFNLIKNNKNFKKLSGVIVGRSDLVGSFGQTKKKVNSNFVLKLIIKNLNKIKKNKILIKIGGSVTPDSKKFFEILYYKGHITSTETRNIEFKINRKNLKDFNKILKKIFEFEIAWLKNKKKLNSKNFGLKLNINYNQRIKEIKKRIGFFKSSWLVT